MDDATAPANGGPSDEEKDLLEFGIELAFRAAGPVVAKSEPEPAEIEGYEILGEIARGGLGVVLRARDLVLGREAAMKVLLRRHQEDLGITQRFVGEARIAGQLQHPGIAPVYQMGRLPDERPYFTMKLVRGKTLAALLTARSDPRAERQRFLGIFDQVCQAVAYAHSQGVIHRDLKPSNVMVGAFGEVQVMDWGLAKVLATARIGTDPLAAPAPPDRAADREASPVDSRPGQVMGTPAYMPPEQARGRVHQLDARSDVFGLGAILCEVLTGAPPFTGKTAEDACRRAAAADLDAVYARLDASGADRELVEIARKALAPAREDRFPDAGALSAAISHYQVSVEDRARTFQVAAAEARGKEREERRARRITLFLSAAILAVLVVSGTGYLLQEKEKTARASLVSREVSAAVEEANLLRGQARSSPENDPAGWPRAVAAARRAVALAKTLAAEPAVQARAARLSEDLEEEERSAREETARRLEERRLVEEIGEIRLQRSGRRKEAWAQTDGRYEQAFHAREIDVASLPEEEAARRIRETLYPVELAAALDDWARARMILQGRDSDGWRRLSRVARKSDPEPLRVRLREAFEEGNVERLRAIADLPGVLDQLPSTLDLLAASLDSAGDPEAARSILRKAVARHPGDFWLNENLGLSYVRNLPFNLQESMRFFSAALALRPQAAAAWNNLGSSLANLGRQDEALEAFRKAIGLQPGYSRAYVNLGGVLTDTGDLEGAMLALREAIRLEPEHALSHGNLGTALLKKGDLDGALAELSEAVRLLPDYPEALWDLATVLAKKRRYEEAVATLRKIETWAGREPERQRKYLDLIGDCERKAKP